MSAILGVKPLSTFALNKEQVDQVKKLIEVKQTKTKTSV